MRSDTAEAEKVKLDATQESETWTREHLDSVKRFQKINKNDFYAVLDIETAASEADIKKAYRKASCHQVAWLHLLEALLACRWPCCTIQIKIELLEQTRLSKASRMW